MYIYWVVLVSGGVLEFAVFQILYIYIMYNLPTEDLIYCTRFISLSQLTFPGDQVRGGGSDYVNLHQRETDKCEAISPLIGRLCSFKSRCPFAFIGTNGPLQGEDIFYSNATLVRGCFKVLG